MRDVFQANRRLLGIQGISRDSTVGEAAFRKLQQPCYVFISSRTLATCPPGTSSGSSSPVLRNPSFSNRDILSSSWAATRTRQRAAPCSSTSPRVSACTVAENLTFCEPSNRAHPPLLFQNTLTCHGAPRATAGARRRPPHPPPRLRRRLPPPLSDDADRDRAREPPRGGVPPPPPPPKPSPPRRRHAESHGVRLAHGGHGTVHLRRRRRRRRHLQRHPRRPFPRPPLRGTEAAAAAAAATAGAAAAAATRHRSRVGRFTQAE